MNGASSQRVVRGPSPAEGFVPSRVLILSGEMGEGHNSAAAALTAAMAEVWPECVVERYDTLGLRGHRFAQAASRGYGFQMKRVPRSYDIYYDWLCRSHAVAAVSKAAIGRFFGVRLEPFLAQHPHDLLISVFPQASAALDWLRTRRGYRGPTVTYIPAFHVHPGWTYPGVDRHFVMYDSAARDARTPGFEATMRVGAPPVRDVFGTVSRGDARKALGIDDERFVV
ncbi:MAG: MGDG synthase family glycosyltransferase, partial [Acidimicrobiales bacterium]